MSDTNEETPEIRTEPSEARTAPERKDKITKPKAPGRVAAGKRLAEMNKKNKAKKSSLRSEVEEDAWDINPGYVIGGLALGVAALSLYLQWRSSSQSEAERSHKVKHVTPTPTPHSAPSEVKKSKIPEME